MGLNTIGAIGQALPPPQSLYPLTINNQPGVVNTNAITLPPGGDFVIPSGTFLVAPGPNSWIQVLDPIENMWRPASFADQAGSFVVNSDGVNYRLNNPTGFPVGAEVNNAGTGYTSAPTVAATPGASTWLAIVGGGVSAININTGGSGVNYAVPPLVSIAAPPSPGVQATAVCAISGGAITGFTIVNPGAGYPSPPAVALVPQGSDLNALSSSVRVTNALGTAQLSYVGTVTAVLLVNEGNNPLAVPPALSFTGGGGTGATATAVMALTITAVTVTTPGSGYTAPVAIQSTGGIITSAAATQNSPLVSTGLFINRNANILATIGSGTGIGLPANAIIDGGLFQAPPTIYAVPGGFGAAASAAAVLAVTMGGTNDTSYITPL